MKESGCREELPVAMAHFVLAIATRYFAYRPEPAELVGTVCIEPEELRGVTYFAYRV